MYDDYLANQAKLVKLSGNTVMDVVVFHMDQFKKLQCFKLSEIGLQSQPFSIEQNF